MKNIFFAPILILLTIQTAFSQSQKLNYHYSFLGELPIEVQLNKLFYYPGDEISVTVYFNNIVYKDDSLLVSIGSSKSKDVEFLFLKSIGKGIYKSKKTIRVADSKNKQKVNDGVLSVSPDEIFGALFYPDKKTQIALGIKQNIIADYGLMKDDKLKGSGFTVLPDIALTKDELQPPPKGKIIGTLVMKHEMPLQIAVDELIFYPKSDREMQDFLQRTNGKILLENRTYDQIKKGQKTTSFLIKVNSDKMDLNEIPQMRKLFGDKELLYASNDRVLKTYALAMNLVMEGFKVGVNPKLHYFGQPVANDIIDISFTDTHFQIPKLWAFNALWDIDTKRVNVAFLDQGFAPNPDFRGFPGSIRQCDFEGSNILDGIIIDFNCTPHIAETSPTVGAGFFGSKVWHGNAVVSVAGGVLNNGWLPLDAHAGGTAGIGGQVIQPMLFRYGIISFAFEMGIGIHKAVDDGASTINISSGYPCRLLDRAGINFNICDDAGRTALCFSITAALEIIAATTCIVAAVTVGLIPFIGPPLAAAICVAAHVPVILAGIACVAQLLISDPTGPLQDGVDFATRHGVIVVASAGNTISSGAPEIFRSILDVNNIDVSDWQVIPAVLNSVICVGAAQSSTPFNNLELAGNRVDIWAPIPSFCYQPPDGSTVVLPPSLQSLNSLGGTSGAAPYITGLIACMQAINPNLNRITAPAGTTLSAIPAIIKNLLQRNAFTPAALGDMSVNPPRRNLVNPMKTIMAASTAPFGPIPDFFLLGYDNQLNFDENPDVAAGDDDINHPNSLGISDHEINKTGSIITILGEPPAGRNIKDVDWYQFNTPSLSGIYTTKISLTFPKNRGRITLIGDGFRISRLGTVSGNEEMVEYTISGLFSETTCKFKISGEGLDDNLYKIKITPSVRDAALPAGDRFDITAPSNPSDLNPLHNRPDNNITDRAVYLGLSSGSNARPWGDDHPGIAGEHYREIKYENLNFNNRADIDWFSIRKIPEFTLRSGTGCQPEIKIETGENIKISVLVNGIVVAHDDNAVTVPSDFFPPFPPSLQIKLEPITPGRFISYNLSIKFNFPSPAICRIAEISETHPEAANSSGRYFFPRYFPEKPEHLPQTPFAKFKRNIDPEQRIIDRDVYYIDWKGGDFTLNADLLNNNSLAIELADVNNKIIAKAVTPDLEKKFQLSSLDQKSGANHLIISRNNLPKGIYLILLSNAHLNTEVQININDPKLKNKL
jgi:subtilisin family serine protease